MLSSIFAAAIAITGAAAQSDIPLSQPIQKVLAGAQQGPYYTVGIVEHRKPLELRTEQLHLVVPHRLHSGYHPKVIPQSQ